MAGALFILLLLYVSNPFLSCLSFNFMFNGFDGSTNNLHLDGSTSIQGGSLELTNDSRNVAGHAFFHTPINLLNNSLSSSSPSNISSFSTTFVLFIVPSSNNDGGFGLAFTLSPTTKFEGAKAGHYLGIFNETNDKNPPNSVFLVEFDTVDGYNEEEDSDGNHIGVNINMNSTASEPAAYYVDETDKKEDVFLQGGKQIQAWIDYDGLLKVVNVSVSYLTDPKPIRPLISRGIDLSSVVKENMFVGFSAATGEKTSFHYILGWSFRVNGVADPLDIDKLPIPPAVKKSNHANHLIKILVATTCVVSFILVGGLVAHFLYRRRRSFEVLEDWELDSPHRFRFKDLFTATKGFKKTELIGVGGFGEVYKGVLPYSGTIVAVKKISNNSLQGLREFVAEIESLGRLRHKNLVNLQGWCKHKNELLLVYEYIPNGSLDSLLYNVPIDDVLTWEQRFHIIKGVAAGLLYLHEEWEQIVIHRDVKSSNVLIDGEMNARLGDFGLARLYGHGKPSHTTHVVGTIGYIAPELTRTGSASTSSDVYAYGILLLEVVCGKPPVINHPEHGQVILMDWVIQCLHLGHILDAVDPKLKSENALVEEMELVLGLGLLCSHPRQEARPTMRQALLYLNGDEALPIFNKLHSVGSRRIEDVTSGYSDFMSTEITGTSYSSSSMGKFSGKSIGIGR